MAVPKELIAEVHLDLLRSGHAPAFAWRLLPDQMSDAQLFELFTKHSVWVDADPTTKRRVTFWKNKLKG